MIIRNKYMNINCLMSVFSTEDKYGQHARLQKFPNCVQEKCRCTVPLQVPLCVTKVVTGENIIFVPTME